MYTMLQVFVFMHFYAAYSTCIVEWFVSLRMSLYIYIYMMGFYIFVWVCLWLSKCVCVCLGSAI